VTNGVFVEPRQLAESDVTPRALQRYRHVVRQHLHWQGKSRFVQKHTGFPRTRYLRRIFPDAKFVHILRDGRAVANSLMNVEWWDGTLNSWWWGAMRPEFEEEYRSSGEAPIVLAAVVWKTLVDLIEPEMKELPPSQACTIRYDALIDDPEKTLADLAVFCGLMPSPTFDRRVRSMEISGADDKWKELPREQRDLLESVLAEHLARLGFG
jgi:hypothetical protein